VNQINFRLIDVNVIDSLLSEVNDNDDLYDLLVLRTESSDSPHNEVSDIILRAPELTVDSTPFELWNSIQCVNYRTFDNFPLVYQHVLDIMRLVDGTQLGRVIITKLKPDGKITPHIDKGDAGDAYTRYHTVLKGKKGNNFTSGRDTVSMLSGQTWWVNNHITHSVHNDTDDDRIHIIMDILI